MRLKNLLFEGRTRKITKEEAVDLYHEMVGVQPHKLPVIYRGVDMDSDFGFIEPRKYNRESAYTSNYYTLLMDNSKNWSEYPDRSRSIVCSSSVGRAGLYGEVYYVFPKIGSNLGVCPEEDIWTSFPYMKQKTGLRNLNKLNEIFLYLDELCISGESFSYDEDGLTESWPELKNELEKIGRCENFEKLYQTGEHVEIMRSFPNYINSRLVELSNLFYPNYKSFYEMIVDLLDPKKNGFRLEKFNRNVSLGMSVEVWTDGPSLLIRKSSFDDDFL